MDVVKKSQVHRKIGGTQGPTSQMTVADGLRVVPTWTDLKPGRVQKLCTALRMSARALAPTSVSHQAADALILDCATFSGLLRRPAATFGMSHSRLCSIRSEVRYVLRRLGLHEPDMRGTVVDSPALRACVEALPVYRRLGMIDFLRFLETGGFSPEQVTGKTLIAYQARCAERTLCVSPVARTRSIAAAWNWAHQHVPDWPGNILKLSDQTGQYSTPISTYPATFQEDLDCYTTRLSGQDIDYIFAEDVFDTEGRPLKRAQRPLKMSSINNRRWIIRCAAAALIDKSGVNPTEIRTLRDLVDPLDHPKMILRFFLERRAGKPSSMADRVTQTLLLLARDYCMLPEAHVAQISEWGNRIAMPDVVGLTEKNTRRLRALIEPRVRAMLLCLPKELVRRAALPGIKPREAARLVMYAVAIEILLICPMRRGNLVGLRLDQHLHQPDPSRQLYTHILINGGEVKNNVPVSWPLPPESQRLIQMFVTRHRPNLVTPGNPFLFGIKDTSRHAQAFGENLARIVTAVIGIDFNIHLARHFAAWNFLRMNPGQYEVVRQVLGHRNLRTTMAHYVGLEADAAAAHFDRVVLHDRQAVRLVAAHAFSQGAGGLRSKVQRRKS